MLWNGGSATEEKERPSVSQVSSSHEGKTMTLEVDSPSIEAEYYHGTLEYLAIPAALLVRGSTCEV